MTTITRRIAARHPRRRSAVIGLAALLPVLALFATLLAISGTNQGVQRPNLSRNIAEVTCFTAHETANAFASAVHDAGLATPDYSGVRAFGFSPPLNPSDVRPFFDLLEARRAQVNAKARSAAEGVCTDSPTATVVDTDGKTKALPLVDGRQPMTPLSGSESNRDSRTVPVTIGTSGDKQRTNSWSELNNLYGNQKWYTDCAKRNLAMTWDSDVPKYVATESKHDNRFILAVNVSSKLTDDQIRAKAADDGNPRVDDLLVVRTESIINTRNLGQDRCDPFIDTRSMIRVSLGKVVLDDKGNFKELKTDEGIFVDCHNLWRLPRSKPVPTPTPTKPPTTPPDTPPTTNPPDKCPPGQMENPNGTCIVPKVPAEGAAHQGKVPTQATGKNPPAAKDPEPRPADPPQQYNPPPPPKDDPEPPPPPRDDPPPVEEPAPRPSDPATGCVPPPGMTEC